MGAVRRRRAYVPRPALRLHAGEVFCAALLAEPRSVAGARLQAGMADVADPEAAGWVEGAGEGGLGATLVSRMREARAGTQTLEARPDRRDGPRLCSAPLKKRCAASGARDLPLIERIAQGRQALLLLAPVAAAGHGAVDDEVVAVDEARLVARQEHRSVSDVIGDAGARDRLCRLVDIAHHRRRLFGGFCRQTEGLAEDAGRDRA